LALTDFVVQSDGIGAVGRTVRWRGSGGVDRTATLRVSGEVGGFGEVGVDRTATLCGSGEVGGSGKVGVDRTATLCGSGKVLCVSGEVVCSCSMFLFDADLSLSSRRKELFCLSRKRKEFPLYFGAEFLLYLKQSFRLCFLFWWEFPFCFPIYWSRVQFDLLEQSSVRFGLATFFSGWPWALFSEFSSIGRSIGWSWTKTYCVG
jgi:hypothetical protein